MMVPVYEDEPFALRRNAAWPRPSTAWLITFADLAALMVAFFALLFSMGEIDTNRWRTAEVAFGVAAGGGAPPDRVWQNIETIDDAPGLDLDYLANVLGQQIDELPALAGARIEVDAQRLIVSLPQALLFDSSGADLKPDGVRAVFALSGALAALSNEIEIVGHTDPLPVTNARWPSSWELSLTRAAVVAHELRRAGYGRPIRIAGAGSGRFHAINPRLPLAARYPLARRVDIVVRRTVSGRT